MNWVRRVLSLAGVPSAELRLATCDLDGLRLALLHAPCNASSVARLLEWCARSLARWPASAHRRFPDNARKMRFLAHALATSPLACAVAGGAAADDEPAVARTDAPPASTADAKVSGRPCLLVQLLDTRNLVMAAAVVSALSPAHKYCVATPYVSCECHGAKWLDGDPDAVQLRRLVDAVAGFREEPADQATSLFVALTTLRVARRPISVRQTPSLPTEERVRNRLLQQREVLGGSPHADWVAALARSVSPPDPSDGKALRVVDGFLGIDFAWYLESVRNAVSSVRSLASPYAYLRWAEQVEDLGRYRAQRASDESRLCQVCAARPRAVALSPCGHVPSCAACLPGLARCPVCRAPVESTLVVYL